MLFRSAGGERNGVTAATADLFDGKRLIITPLDTTDEHAFAGIYRFWQNLGFQVATMSAEHHDTVLAATSHLPHILAFALVAMLGRKDEQREIFKYAAGGFKDFSRIASSDPTMWLDICMANKDELMPLLREFRGELQTLENMLIERQNQALYDEFVYANQSRQRFLEVFGSGNV